MKFVYPQLHTVIDTADGALHTLVIEHQTLFRTLLQDLTMQLAGEEGYAVVSQDDTPLNTAKYAELLDRFVPFELNRKPLLNKIAAALERTALQEQHYAETMQTLAQTERLLEMLAFDFSCDIVFPPVTAAMLIKAASPQLRAEEKSLAEQVLDYMQLVCEFERPKLFITVNLRSYIPDAEMVLFADTALSHGYALLMLENREYPRLPQEKRWIVDKDLCEIT